MSNTLICDVLMVPVKHAVYRPFVPLSKLLFTRLYKCGFCLITCQELPDASTLLVNLDQRDESSFDRVTFSYFTGLQLTPVPLATHSHRRILAFAWWLVGSPNLKVQCTSWPVMQNANQPVKTFQSCPCRLWLTHLTWSYLNCFYSQFVHFIYRPECDHQICQVLTDWHLPACLWQRIIAHTILSLTAHTCSLIISCCHRLGLSVVTSAVLIGPTAHLHLLHLLLL